LVLLLCSPPLFDTVMVGISRALEQHKKQRLVNSADAIREGFQRLFEEPEWVDTVAYTRKGPLLKRQAMFDAMVQRTLQGRYVIRGGCWAVADVSA
jgi:hypothetical protein